ncbi:RNA polymerase sigma-70 factor, ECF subfamily [Chitinophaga costaii]|uniref:RNA polymerase sigma-70 factor, ECF subfamily n=1 Tax=Chitinophaga costaii TaxID=1335309 RepID=A0A1C4E1R0_9BACT|nr:sigma-70 family RNA polymerase sigma factor [Chitinophaga costaii]PUZ24370.1 hypothetical protein DCM91_13160 [Chitinophaga costaii]SCC37509.1 RNA polymerase sigma-70 factor, ECF subfamily [Chitinophaga costaii]
MQLHHSNNTDEKSLLLQIAAGDATAFKVLYRRYLPDAYSLAISFLHMPQAAEDLVQDLFIKLWLKREEMAGIERFRPYMMVSLRNMLINELDKMKNRLRHEQLGSHLLFPPATPYEETTASELQAKIQEALQALNPQQQLIYRLSREQGKDIASIAQELNVAPKTVSNTISIVLHHLRSYLHEYGYIFYLLFYMGIIL